MRRGELSASLTHGAASAAATRVNLDDTPVDGTPLEDTTVVMARRRRAVIVGLGVLAVLQAADVFATWALLANDGAANPPSAAAVTAVRTRRRRMALPFGFPCGVAPTFASLASFAPVMTQWL